MSYSYCLVAMIHRGTDKSSGDKILNNHSDVRRYPSGTNLPLTCSSLPTMLLGGGVRIRVWIREQRRSKEDQWHY